MDRKSTRGRSTATAAQSEAQLASVYRRYSADVMAYALRRCNAEDAADVVSETFVVAWRRIGELPEEPAVKPWLLGVARRVLANQRRGVRRRTELVRKASVHLAPRFHEISEIEHLGEAQLMVDAMQKLSRADQELLMLSAWEELSPTEISVVLGVSGGTVRKRLFRARKRLAAVVEKNDSDKAHQDKAHKDKPRKKTEQEAGERSPESGHLLGKTRPKQSKTGKGVAAS